MKLRYLRILASLIWVLALSSLLVQPAKADDLYARIQGTVTDPTGAAAPGVKLVARNTGTNISYEGTSGATGNYQFLNLPVGTYTVSANRPGFRTVTSTAVTLTVGQIYTLNIAMELGQISEIVTVEANPVQVNTTSAQLGTVVSASQIVNIPLIRIP